MFVQRPSTRATRMPRARTSTERLELFSANAIRVSTRPPAHEQKTWQTGRQSSRTEPTAQVDLNRIVSILVNFYETNNILIRTILFITICKNNFLWEQFCLNKILIFTNDRCSWVQNV